APVFHKHGDITCPVTHQWHGLFYQRRYNHFTLFAVSKTFSCFWINDFDKVTIMPDMQAIMLGAFKCNTRSKELAHAIRIESGKTKTIFERNSHGIRPWLSAEYACFQAFKGFPHFFSNLRKMHGVTRRAVNCGNAKIPDHFDLAPGISRRARDHGHSYQFCTIMES